MACDLWACDIPVLKMCLTSAWSGIKQSLAVIDSI